MIGISLTRQTAVGLAVLFAGLLQPQLARAEDYECPKTIDVAESAVRLPHGWKAVLQNGERHSAYMSLSGPDGITIGHDTEEEYPNGWKLLWILKHVEGQRFVKCEYSRSGIIVVQKIPDDLEYCELTKMTANGLDKFRMHCGR